LPYQRIVANLSGYSAATIEDRGEVTYPALLIEKPFTAEALGRFIRRLVERMDQGGSTPPIARPE